MVFKPVSKDHKSINSLLIPLFNPWWMAYSTLGGGSVLAESTESAASSLGLLGLRAEIVPIVAIHIIQDRGLGQTPRVE